MAPNPCENIIEVCKFLIKEYIIMEHSFTKCKLLPEQLQKGPDGKPWPWKWGKKRLLNEPYALNLIKEYTTITAPRLLDSGVDNQGHSPVTMERIYGIELEDIGNKCRRPTSEQKSHVSYGKWDACADVGNKIDDSSLPISSFISFNSSRPTRPDSTALFFHPLASLRRFLKEPGSR